MEADLRCVARRYAVFLVLFSVAVCLLWLFGAELFSLLLQKSRAYIPPQFLTWLSLASSVCIVVAFCVMPFSLFRIVRERSDVPFGWVVLCIAGFLFLLGLSAFLGLLNIWFHGPIVIWSLVLTRMGSALLAVATLLILRALVPRIVEIPSRSDWLALHKDLLRIEPSAEEKAKLLAAVSHELRRPLAPLLACLTELEHHVASLANPEVRNCIQVLRKNVLREAQVVSDLVERLEIPTPEPVAALTPGSGDVRPQRLLLVEDHADTLRTFAKMLRQQGFEVQEAQTFSEAMDTVRAGDFLVSDIALPDGDGRDLMRYAASMGIPGIAGFRDGKRSRRIPSGWLLSFLRQTGRRQSGDQGN